MKILVINGPNLNTLGSRSIAIYGDCTLQKIEDMMREWGKRFEVEVITFQSNSEGALIDFIQTNSLQADGIIINLGALTHYSFAIRDALFDVGLPIIEVHLSNIYAREDWRSKSVIAPIVKGQITGLGWRGYLAALQVLAMELKGRAWE